MILDITEHEAQELKGAIATQIGRLDDEILIINMDMDLLDRNDTFYSDNVLSLQCRRAIVDQQLYTLSKLYKLLGGELG